MSLQPGARLGPYEVVAPIGAGGMGEVYRARDIRLDRLVAIKVLSELLAKDVDRLRRFEHEARILSALNHPNLLSIYDVGTQDDIHYLVSEFLDGHTLRERIGGGPLPQRRAIEYGLQIADGLSAAHAKGIVHRDLKPDNLFVTRDERIKILDFGLAKQTQPTSAVVDGATLVGAPPTEAGVVMGTVGYMSPEQVRAQATDHRSDIFSFGAILYEAASGTRAFQRTSSVETMNAIINEEPPELTESGVHLNPGLERIIRRCLEKVPERRFQSASDLAFALDAISGTSGVTPAASSTRRFSSRAAIPVLVGILALSLGTYFGTRLVHHPTVPVKFQRLTFRPGIIFAGRFAPDGESIVYSGAFDGRPAGLYSQRRAYPEPQLLGMKGAVVLLAASKQGQMAVLMDANYLAHFTWQGTLAVAPLGGTAPRELIEQVTSADWSPDGKNLAVIRHVGNKYRLEYPAGKLLYETENWIDSVRVSPDGVHLALFQHPPGLDDRGDVLVIDPSGSIRTVSTGWEEEEGLAWVPSGKEIWFSAVAAGMDYSIHAVTPAGVQRVVASQTGSLRIHDIAASGEALVSVDENMSRIDLVLPNASPSDASWLNVSWAPTLSRDGSLIALTDQSEYGGNTYAVYIRNTDGGSAVRLGEGYVNDISADHKWVVAADLKGGAALLPVGAGEPRRLHWNGMHIRRAAFLPDSRRVLMIASENGSGDRVYLTDIDGVQPKPLSRASVDKDYLPISPDGRCFIYATNGQWLTQSIDTGDVSQVPGVGRGEYVVRWNSDKTSVYVARASDTDVTFYRVSLDSGSRELLKRFRPAFQVGLMGMHNGYFACDVDESGRTMALAYDTDVDKLYAADGLK